MRAWKKHGWSALRKRPLAATYWRNLSAVERVLLWLGFVALYITLVSATGWKVINLFGQRVARPWAQTSNLPLEPISGYGTLPHFINDGSAASRYPDDGSERSRERRIAEALGCPVAAVLWRTAA